MIFQACKGSIEYKVSCIELRKKKRKDTKKCYPLFFYLATHIRFTLIKESIELRKRGKTKPFFYLSNYSRKSLHSCN